MRQPDFKFKQFQVWHNECAMKVGTDAVLLGAWVNLQNATSVLDVGTGCGIIALMCAQRSDAFIEAVESDKNSVIQAKDNFAKSPWHSRLTACHESFAAFTSSRKFDVIVSNPPYFRNSLKPPDTLRSAARHDDNLSYETLIRHSAKLCSARSRLSVIIPYADLGYFTGIAALNGFWLQRNTLVYSRPGERAVRCLLEFSANRCNTPVTETLNIRKVQSNAYSDEYTALTREFYLYM